MCEARERGAGLALVLASGAELERLIAALELAYCSLTVILLVNIIITTNSLYVSIEGLGDLKLG